MKRSSTETSVPTTRNKAYRTTRKPGFASGLSRSQAGPRSAVLFGAALCLPLMLLPAALPGTAAAAGTAPAAQQASPASAARQAAELRLAAPYFKALPQSGDRASLGVNYYEAAGSSLNVTGRSGEMLEVLTPGGEKAYVPSWYTGSAAYEASAAKPLILQLKPEASLHLYPGSEANWPGDYAASGLISAVRSGDWYGVVLPASPAYAGGSVIRPSLLWVQSSQVASTQQIVTGLLAADSTVPLEMVRSLAETSLAVGTSEEDAEALLGTPYSRTPLPHYSTSDPAGTGKRGELWRYERGVAQFTVSFDTRGKLAGWNWILPTAEAAQAQVNPNQPPYAFTYDFRLLTPMPSISPQALWQAQSDLDAQYLSAASDDTLLVRGSADGGAGLGEELYALDRSDGTRLWQVETGSGGFDSLLGQDGRSALVLTRADPRNGGKPLLRSLRLSDGKVLWSREAEGSAPQTAESSRPVRLSAADTSVLLSTQPSEGGKGTLTALSQRSGSVRWTKEFVDPYKVLNEGSNDPYVLVQQNRWIQALEPRTGKAVWSIKTDEDTLPDSALESGTPVAPRIDPFERGDGTRWVTFGRDRVRLDTSGGKILARYAISPNERAEVLQGSYLLVRRSIDSQNYDGGSLFETSLYDTKQQREVWKIPGKLERAMLSDDLVYGLLGGVPTALSLSDGQPVWKTATSEFALANPHGRVDAGSFVRAGRILLLPYGPDLLTFDAETGAPLRRIDGVAFAYVENDSPLLRNGALNRDGETLYVGSANGRFAAFDADALTEQIQFENPNENPEPNE
ncbi:hypothetical protein CDO73_23140 [Saccharibacillus sp. O23]|uniref:outer membrane protein assembly factor BamB family protein n=1 Tax=Saccharibacillus sp. O23 TaxID=2009338 RepID=UPI000B4E7C6D|nr:PQQ-binding-like beta-propeller repeat protein [Saccharibacillus sp. O23]OWR27149.1 hypothetical protein CDO73_23140 [Saccharibacillus sp. O23]